MFEMPPLRRDRREDSVKQEGDRVQPVPEVEKKPATSEDTRERNTEEARGGSRKQRKKRGSEEPHLGNFIDKEA